MIKLEDIEALWEVDCEINSHELDVAALDIPKLHNKYLKHHNRVRVIILQLEDKLAEEVSLKSQYYAGKLSKEELDENGLEPFPHRVLRNDLKNYLESDAKIKQLHNKVEYSKIVLDYLKSIIEQINKRNFSIKAAIDWRKFTSGEV